MLAFIIGMRGHVGVQARTTAPSQASSWFPDPSLPPVPRRAPEAGGEQGGHRARISGEGELLPLLPAPGDLGLPAGLGDFLVIIDPVSENIDFVFLLLELLLQVELLCLQVVDALP